MFLFILEITGSDMTAKVAGTRARRRCTAVLRVIDFLITLGVYQRSDLYIDKKFRSEAV